MWLSSVPLLDQLDRAGAAKKCRSASEKIHNIAGVDMASRCGWLGGPCGRQTPSNNHTQAALGRSGPSLLRTPIPHLAFCFAWSRMAGSQLNCSRK
jgi:hypothetical protein